MEDRPTDKVYTIFSEAKARAELLSRENKSTYILYELVMRGKCVSEERPVKWIGLTNESDDTTKEDKWS
jgi:hypothetical protein